MLLKPRFWLIAAAASAVGWVLIGYHQDQLAAQIVLDKKAGAASSVNQTGTDLTLFRQILFALACLFGALACLISFRSQQSTVTPPETPSGETANKPDGSGAFQPIRTQEEIVGEEKAQATMQKQKRGSRAVSQFAQSALQLIRPVRSRQ